MKSTKPEYAIVYSYEEEGVGDLWKSYFYKGKQQMARAEVTFAPFDHKALS